jgi:Rrf2 family nitric oxide-sensitive transcriptional repressor
MHLTLYTDYSLRVLIYLGTRSPELGSIPQISAAYGISRNHLVKVVNRLGHLGYVQTLRGRGGGLRLARDASEIRLGQLVRDTEAIQLVECFDAARNRCPITPACGLKRVLSEATEAFLAVLDRYTVADLLTQRERMRELLGLGIPLGLPGAPADSVPRTLELG